MVFLRGILRPELKRAGPALLFKSGFSWNIGDKSRLLPLDRDFDQPEKEKAATKMGEAGNQITALLSILQNETLSRPQNSWSPPQTSLPTPLP